MINFDLTQSHNYLEQVKKLFIHIFHTIDKCYPLMQKYTILENQTKMGKRVHSKFQKLKKYVLLWETYSSKLILSKYLSNIFIVIYYDSRPMCHRTWQFVNWYINFLPYNIKPIITTYMLYRTITIVNDCKLHYSKYFPLFHNFIWRHSFYIDVKIGRINFRWKSRPIITFVWKILNLYSAKSDQIDAKNSLVSLSFFFSLP